MGKILALFKSRLFITIVGLLLLSLLIWFGGPYLGFGESQPLASQVARLLLIVVIGGAYAVKWLRKRMWSSDEAEMPSMGFTLGDLRQLHKEGKLSDAEFERTKEKIVAAAQRAAERQSAKPPGPNPRNPGIGGR